MGYRGTVVFSSLCTFTLVLRVDAGTLIGWWYMFPSCTWLQIRWTRTLLSRFYLYILSEEFDLDVRMLHCVVSGIVSHFCSYWLRHSTAVEELLLHW